MKKMYFILTFVGLFLLSSFAQAADKVVVVPLFKSSSNVAASGLILRGQLSVFNPPNNSSGFKIIGDSFAKPLPAGTPTPTLEYTSSTTLRCPGIGFASAGILCVYGYNEKYVSAVVLSGGSEEENRLYGFSLDITFSDKVNAGFFLASWAYQVP
jgi:hypothetical protein